MFEQIKTLLVNELQISAKLITLEADLARDLELNSLELAEFVLMCEEKFDIVIKDEDLKKLTTVGDIVTYVEKSIN